MRFLVQRWSQSGRLGRDLEAPGNFVFPISALLQAGSTHDGNQHPPKNTNFAHGGVREDPETIGINLLVGCCRMVSKGFAHECGAQHANIIMGALAPFVEGGRVESSALQSSDPEALQGSVVDTPRRVKRNFAHRLGVFSWRRRLRCLPKSDDKPAPSRIRRLSFD